MEKMQNRRNFLKKVSVVAGLSQLPLPGWAEGFSTLLNLGVNPGGEFSLLKLEILLPAYQLPLVGKFSTGSFNSQFTHYNLYGNNAIKAGELSLNSDGKGEIRQFDFTSSRLANSGIKERDQIFKYVVSGKVHCQNNMTLSPQKWNVASKISLSDLGEPFGGSGLITAGEVREGELRLNTGGKEIRKSIGKVALSWKWGLIAVAQKMAEESSTELQFAMLDEFDAFYKNQKMQFRRKVNLDCGNDRLIDFKVFELTGDGVIPAVYWVDNKNRTVFVVSGMEAFILKT